MFPPDAIYDPAVVRVNVNDPLPAANVRFASKGALKSGEGSDGTVMPAMIPECVSIKK
jgi:hypothetical protein